MLIRHNFLVKIVALLIAVLLWFYLRKEIIPESVQEERYLKHIPVQVFLPHASEQEYWAADIVEKQIQILIRGPREKLDALNVKNIIAYIDLSEISNPGTYITPIKIIIPEGLVLISKPSNNRVVVRYVRIGDKRTR